MIEVTLLTECESGAEFKNGPHYSKTVMAKYLAKSGDRLIDIMRTNDLSVHSEFDAPCGGQGLCGKCRVRRIEGDVGNLTSDEIEKLSPDDIEVGIRLACQVSIFGNATFCFENYIENNTSKDHANSKKHRILTEGIIPEFEFEPNVGKIRELENTTVIIGGEFAGTEAGDTTEFCFGVAVDIGTTTVAVSLVDLATGDEVAFASAINPQTDFGMDVLTRINYAQTNKDGLNKLSSLIVNTLNELIAELSHRAGISKEYIYEVAVAGNTTMLHILLGVDVKGLGVAPYLPVFTASKEVQASKLGLDISDFGIVYCLPSISSYLGADITAGIVASGLHKENETALFIDIGTNGEIVLNTEGKLLACSCAAGPAFEGMNIEHGMQAADGAIEHVYLDGIENHGIGNGFIANDYMVKLDVIGNTLPIGLCGSGIIDAVAELVKVGIVDASGRFVAGCVKGDKENTANNGDRKNRFVLAKNGQHEVVVTQKDVRQIQLAKAAIVSGISVLVGWAGIDISDVERIYVAGAFGHNLRLDSLVRLGVLPEGCVEKTEIIGNSSKSGAMMYLLSWKMRTDFSQVADSVTYIELSSRPDYERLFVDSLKF